MNAAYGILRFFFGGKELKILLVILALLFLLPTFAVIAIAATPAALLQQAFAGSSTASTVNPAPSGVAVLGSFIYPSDEYAPGNCTYWVYARRAQVGEPIPNSWGNAATWASNAFFGGYAVDHTPTPDAIMQTPNVDNGLGHVAFVESVDPDGTWHISEMNVLGLYIVDHKAMPAAAAAAYNFIHTKRGA